MAKAFFEDVCIMPAIDIANIPPPKKYITIQVFEMSHNYYLDIEICKSNTYKFKRTTVGKLNCSSKVLIFCCSKLF